MSIMNLPSRLSYLRAYLWIEKYSRRRTSFESSLYVVLDVRKKEFFFVCLLYHALYGVGMKVIFWQLLAVLRSLLLLEQFCHLALPDKRLCPHLTFNFSWSCQCNNEEAYRRTSDGTSATNIEFKRIFPRILNPWIRVYQHEHRDEYSLRQYTKWNKRYYVCEVSKKHWVYDTPSFLQDALWNTTQIVGRPQTCIYGCKMVKNLEENPRLNYYNTLLLSHALATRRTGELFNLCVQRKSYSTWTSN